MPDDIVVRAGLRMPFVVAHRRDSFLSVDPGLRDLAWSTFPLEGICEPNGFAFAVHRRLVGSDDFAVDALNSFDVGSDVVPWCRRCRRPPFSGDPKNGARKVSRA